MFVNIYFMINIKKDTNIINYKNIKKKGGSPFFYGCMQLFKINIPRSWNG